MRWLWWLGLALMVSVTVVIAWAGIYRLYREGALAGRAFDPDSLEETARWAEILAKDFINPRRELPEHQGKTVRWTMPVLSVDPDEVRLRPTVGQGWLRVSHVNRGPEGVLLH